MAVRTRITPIEREIRLLYDRALSPEAQADTLRGAAMAALGDAQAVNAGVLGYTPGHETFVDGQEVAGLESVRGDSTITYRFELLTDVIAYIDGLLVISSPVLRGTYARSHILFADDVEADIDNPPPAKRYIILNTVPYARKIERGQSKKAPNGVYEAVAAMAKARYGNVAAIGFTYRSPLMPYVAGGANRAERAALRQQPARQAAMRMERATRSPAISIDLGR